MLHGQINRHSCFNDDLHFHRAESCLSKIFSRSAEMSFDVSTQNGLQVMFYSIFMYCINTSGGPLSALTCCVNVRLLSAIKKISLLIYSQSWVGSWVYTTQAMMTFTLIF